MYEIKLWDSEGNYGGIFKRRVGKELEFLKDYREDLELFYGEYYDSSVEGYKAMDERYMFML